MKRFIAYALMTVLALSAVHIPNVCLAAEPVFSISAEDNTGTGSSVINVYLEGKNLNDLYAYEAVLSFDSEKLEIVKTASEINGFSVAPKVDGNKAYIAFTKVGNVNGENGDKKLNIITFRGKQPGTAKIRLESVKTVNSELSSHTYTPGKIIFVTVRRTGLVLEPVLDNETKAAVSVLSLEQIDKLLSEAKADSYGRKTIEIELLPAGNAREYVLKFPSQVLAGRVPETYFIIRTPLGIIRIPGNMLAEETVNNSEYVSVRIGTADTGNFSESLKSQIGGRPAVTLKADIDGKTITWNNPNTAVNMTVPYHPTVDEAADPDHIIALYIDEDGNAKPVETGVYNSQQNTVSFMTNCSGTFAVSYAKKTFDDIKGHWSQKYVEVMASRGIIKGLPDNSFGCRYYMTRADYVTLLVRILGISLPQETNFDDVKPEDYFFQTVGTARKAGIVKSSDNLFRPRDPVTREEMMIFTASALKYVKPETWQVNYDVLKNFSDANLLSPEAVQSAAVLVQEKIIVGAGGKLLPKEKMTRAEAAAVLYRLFKVIWSE